jgi:hypothetical protein
VGAGPNTTPEKELKLREADLLEQPKVIHSFLVRPDGNTSVELVAQRCREIVAALEQNGWTIVRQYDDECPEHAAKWQMVPAKENAGEKDEIIRYHSFINAWHN